MFSGKLEVGQLAMIIGTAREANRVLIGKIVTVEYLSAVDDDVSKFFIGPKLVREAMPRMVFASGVEPIESGSCSDGVTTLIPNHIRLRSEYLMPLPPLEEEELLKEQELELA